MKFINLNRDYGEPSHLHSVLSLGCGPNFIRNRAEKFETMIKEQGLEFWFRFWLSFCLYHNVLEFDEFEEEVPGWVTSMFQAIHCNFVEVSSKDALKFCWNTILKPKDFSQLLSVSPSGYRTPSKKKAFVYRHQQFADLSSEYIQITFACALGEIFHKWLNAEENTDLSRKYWTIPKRYLEHDFKPGVLEKFLVNKWGIKLTRFFGVKAEKLPWIRQMLRNDRDVLKNINDPLVGKQTDTPIAMQDSLEQHIELWKSKIAQLRKEIQMVDEARKEDCAAGKYLKRVPKDGQQLNRKYFIRNVSCRSEIFLQPNLRCKKNTSSNESIDQITNIFKRCVGHSFASCTNTSVISGKSKNKQESEKNCSSSFPHGYKIDFI